MTYDEYVDLATLREESISEAIEILYLSLNEHGCTLGTWCAKGSAVHKLQSAIRYLEAQLKGGLF